MVIRKALTEEERRKKKRIVRPIGPSAIPEGQEPRLLEKEGKDFIIPKREFKELERRGKVDTEAPTEERRQADIEAAKPGLEATFVERQVGKEVIQEPIIPPEQENLGVMLRIAESIIPDIIKQETKIAGIPIKDLIGGKKKAISQVEITTIAADLREAVISQSSAEMDRIIIDTENGITEIGLLPPNFLPPVTKEVGVAGIVAAGVAGGIVSGPIKEFVGTDGQIRSLELALSQYNEMITIPARSIAAGLPPEIAFDKLDRMEEGILALESQLKLSSLTSTKVALALRGRGIEARLLKLKEKLQEGRLLVFQRATQEAFGEVDIPSSMSFLRSLQK